MSDKYCGKCGSKIDKRTGQCPNCKKEKSSGNNQKKFGDLNQEHTKNGKKRIRNKSPLLVVLLLVILMSLVLGFTWLCFTRRITNIRIFSKTGNSFETNGNVVSLDKDFTSKRIVDSASAILAAQESAPSLGLNNAFDELELYSLSETDGQKFYRLQQLYNGLPVYGCYVTIIASDQGEALGLLSDCKDIDESISLIPSISQEEIENNIKQYAISSWGELYDDFSIQKITDDKLVIYNQDDSSHLAYRINVSNGKDYTVIVDSISGVVLESISNIEEVSSTGTSSTGSVSFPIDYDKESDTYHIYDTKRDISIFNLEKNSSKTAGWNTKAKQVTSKGDNIFGNTEDEKKQLPDKAISLINNIGSIADFFKTNFRAGIPCNQIMAFYQDGFDFGKNALGGTVTLNDGSLVGFLSIGHSLNGTESDILAHEYTHIMAKVYDAATFDNGQTGAISEGLADTFSCFYTGSWDIDLTPVGGKHRSPIDPSKYNYPSKITDKNKSGSDAKHGYATVISHAAYLMNQSGAFSNSQLPKLWYKTLICLPHKCSFYDLRFVMEKNAIASNCSDGQITAIHDAFDEVGIADSSNYNCGNTININVYDKNGAFYDDYTISVEGKTAGAIFGIGSKAISFSRVQNNSTSYPIELANGEYEVHIIDNAKSDTSSTFRLSVKSSNKVENIYAFDYGADYTVSSRAFLSVKDSTGNEVSNYTATVLDGKNNHTITNKQLDLPEKNYYSVLLSQRDDSLGVTYYHIFTLRIKKDFGNYLEIYTNFDAGMDDNTIPSIPPEAVSYYGHKYYLFSGGIASSFEEAARYCHSKGGYLATITSKEENDFLYTYITNLGVESAYFGFSDSENEGKWEWCNGEGSSYTNWHTDEPNGEAATEDYAMFYEQFTDGTWNDGDFGKLTDNGGNAFICEWGDYSTQESQPNENGNLSKDRNVILTLDVSGSMDGTPLDETKKASNNFISTILKEDANIGIVTYADTSEIATGLSSEKTNLQEIVSNLYANGGTNIEAGLRDARWMLEKNSAQKKIIVLMSDGEPNEGLEGEDLIAYADAIKKEGIRIYTIGFFDSLEDKSYAQYLMEHIASDGCHYEVANADDLVFFFGDMADQINGQKYIYIRIACPVDVSVTYNGETLNSSEEDMNARTSFGTLTFEESKDEFGENVDERVKVLRLKEGTDYDLKLTGTGHGIMNYTIGFMDDKGEYSDLRRFEKVKITSKTNIDTVASAGGDSILNIDQNGDGKYDLRLQAEPNGYAEEIRSFNMLRYIVIAAGVLLIADLLALILFLRSRRKGR